MKYNKWTDEQIDFVLKLRADGLTWNRISRALENTYGIKRTGANINNKINHTMKKEENKMKIPENYEPATKKQCRYYAQLKSDVKNSKLNSMVGRFVQLNNGGLTLRKVDKLQSMSLLSVKSWRIFYLISL